MNYRTLGAFLFIAIISHTAHAQVGIAGYVDPAMTHNALIRETSSEAAYKLIGPYKVVGTSFLFGEKNKGSLYTPESGASHGVFISYNTYNQEVEFFGAANPNKALTKTPGQVDSMVIDANPNVGLENPLKLIYGSHLGTNDKSFYVLVYKGNRFSLYKKYKSDLGYVSTNYVQSELRQFDLSFEFYYTDSTKSGIKKLKRNSANVVSEFKPVKDITSLVDPTDFSANPEAVLLNVFQFLNKD